MAGNENGSGPTGTEEALTSRLQWLRQRRQALQEKLILKNNELKNLCIDEAELTGILPAEIPLEPGESPPSFRRRVGTTFTYPANLINKLKTTEAEECALESERQIQIGIAEAAFGKFNDPAESKAVRRKYRLIYQQSQKRLQELDTRLSFIRQSHGKSQRNAQSQATANYNGQTSHGKHRIKKPRPPLESNVSKSSRGLLQEGGVSLSPLAPSQQEHNYNTYPGTGYQEAEIATTVQPPMIYNRPPHVVPLPAQSSPQHSPKLMMQNDMNENHNVYILPDQYRARTYSHGSGGSRNANHYLDAERTYRPVPNTYTEQERMMRYRPIQQQQLLLQNHQQYPPDYTPQYYPETDNTRRYTHTPDYHPRREASRVSSRSNGPPTDPHQPPGYWVRYEDEIIWCPDDQTVDKFGSLDRRKRNTIQHVSSSVQEAQTRYHTVAGSKSTSILPRHNVPLNPPQDQNPPSQTSSRMLLRTQSLGSVETWTSGQSQDSVERDATDNCMKVKEKGWYETSLDSGPPGPAGMPHKKIKQISMRDNNVDEHQKQRRYQHQPPKILEIPAESKSLNNNDLIMESSSTGSKNCTIVQAGKYQPYREVTKPFEMSDFYKYSTKYRKRNENQSNSPVMTNNVNLNGGSTTTTTTAITTKLPQDPRVNMMIQMSKDLRIDNRDQNNVAPSPVQKRIYQPLQRMTCQPYNALR